MFSWFRKRRDSQDGPAAVPIDATLRAGVDAMVAFLRVVPTADDDVISGYLIGSGLSEAQATKLIQFVPIAFTRFLYRTSGVRFSSDYVVLGPDMQPIARRPVADEPAYRAAWDHCEQAAVKAGDDYFLPIAARSGGYQALQELVQKGSKLSGIITSPPMMMQ